nr:hypothetical protein [Tanacetum cinerariifolium]
MHKRHERSEFQVDGLIRIRASETHKSIIKKNPGNSGATGDNQVENDQYEPSGWLKVLNEFNKSALQKRTKDMLMGKWKMLNGSSFCDETKGKAFSKDGPWEILRKHPIWDANNLIDPVDEIGHTELFRDDARPCPSTNHVV